MRCCGARAWTRGRRLLWLVAACAAAFLALSAPALGSVAPRVALERAKALLSGDASSPARDATPVLRDLAVGLTSLGPSERRTARRLLARPFAGARISGAGKPGPGREGRRCDKHLCVHWVEDGPDAPPGSDGKPHTVPYWVRTTFDVLRHVWAAEVDEMGYRAPLGDSASPENGGDRRLDVYLADVGDSVYGYCTSDDPRTSRQTRDGSRSLSAFCVLDNDYAASQFPSVHGLPALEVTAAHEFFHAVQFAYDAWEDTWLMEGTATWMEDEVYDDVNDNRQFLAQSPLTEPGTPLDLNAAPSHYGAWIWWRYLSEQLGRDVIRAVWERADGTPGAPNDYSLAATRAALAAIGVSFADVFAGFATANRFPATSYEEGRAYRAARPAGTWKLGRVRPSTGWTTLRLDHLTSRSVSFRPGPTARPDARLRLALDLPPLRRGSAARLVTLLRDGGRSVRSVRLDAAGNATLTVPFAAGRVARVVLVLADASTRLEDCGRWATPYSCSGVPSDDRVTFRFRATVR